MRVLVIILLLSVLLGYFQIQMGALLEWMYLAWLKLKLNGTNDASVSTEGRVELDPLVAELG